MTSILENHYVYDRNLNLIICQIIFGQGWREVAGSVGVRVLSFKTYIELSSQSVSQPTQTQWGNLISKTKLDFPIKNYLCIFVLFYQRHCLCVECVCMVRLGMECMIIFWYFDYHFENCLHTYYPLIFAVFTFTTQSVNTGVYFLVLFIPACCWAAELLCTTCSPSWTEFREWM